MQHRQCVHNIIFFCTLVGCKRKCRGDQNSVFLPTEQKWLVDALSENGCGNTCVAKKSNFD